MARQPKSVLKQADEIKFLYKDKDRLIDYIEEFSDKTFILIIPKGVEASDISWELYRTYSEKVNFILALEDLNLYKNCQDNNIKFYWNYPIFTWFELDGIIKLNPCYLFINGALTFNLQKLKEKTDIPLRCCPNVAYMDSIPRENGIYGAWIRPEDIEVYKQYVNTFEFMATALSEEAALLEVYQRGNWPGNLNLLLTNLNIQVDNRALPDELGQMRANCGRRCLISNNCHFCETAMKFADVLRSKHYEMKKISPIE